MKRYTIEACDLGEVKSKHAVVWHKITTAWTFNGMLRKFDSVNNHADGMPVFVRVYDNKTGKAIL